MRRRSAFADVEQLIDQLRAEFEEMGAAAGTAGSTGAALDLVEYDDEYVVTVDLPGYRPDDVSARIHGRTLVVDADREERDEVEEDGGRYVRRERRHATSVQEVTFPQDVRADDVSGSLDDGVLTVRVPKADPDADGRRIEID